MKISGACFCKAIEYETTIDPGRVGLCHCRDCQIFSGSAFRMSGAVDPAEFSFTRGAPKFFDKVADSGKVRRMAFCDQCGTHLCSMPLESEEGGFVSVRLATANEFGEMRPTAELYCSSRVSWLNGFEGTFQLPGMPE